MEGNLDIFDYFTLFGLILQYVIYFCC